MRLTAAKETELQQRADSLAEAAAWLPGLDGPYQPDQLYAIRTQAISLAREATRLARTTFNEEWAR